MNPTFFPQANIVMRRPKSMTEDECCDIQVYKDETQVISCWLPTPEERIKLALGEPVYLYVFGPTMPPVWVSVTNPWQEVSD